MRNFEYDQLPKSWSEYYGQPEALNAARDFLTKTPEQTIFISGDSGVGKTAFVLLLIKAYRCLNRAPDSMEPCNECANCKQADIRQAESTITDVHWIQPGLDVDKSLLSSVNEALAAAAKGSTFTGHKDNILFIVLDEFQKFNSNIRQQFLANTDTPTRGLNVCYIFITMQEAMIDITETKAFRRRSLYLNLKSFTKSELYDYLINKFPNCPAESAAIIAKAADRTIGDALQIYNRVSKMSPELDPEATAYIAGFANNKQRWSLWEHILSGDKILDLKDKLERLERAVPLQRLASQLIEDILISADENGGPDEIQTFALRMLTQYQCNYINVDLLSYLTQLYRMPVVTESAVNTKSDFTLNYACQN